MASVAASEALHDTLRAERTFAFQVQSSRAVALAAHQGVWGHCPDYRLLLESISASAPASTAVCNADYESALVMLERY